MKKKIIVIFLLVMVIFIFKFLKAEDYIIPNEAIRMRIIANSNDILDQQIKTKVRDNLQANVYELLKESKTINEADILIKKNINVFDNTVKTTLQENNYNKTYTIDFGNHYFPEKEYKGVKYKEGEYKSLLVTLGEGNGDNWWCVLFPPLCLIEAEEANEVEYKFFLKEIIDKYF